jgi:1-acyl-sn-glycerol-3-phosphate acyltransferase
MQSPRVFKLGPNVPRRGNTFSYFFGLFLLWLLGWRMRGDFPNVRKGMIIIAPHTSNYDGLVAVAGIMAMRLQLFFFVKDSAFVGPFGLVMKWFGARPVDRENSKDLVGFTARQYHAADALMLAIAPEGTRNASPSWKTGFYWMAHQAGVPIIMVAFDYATREIVMLGCFTPTGDIERDLPEIVAHYRDITPRHTERLSAPLRTLRRPD